MADSDWDSGPEQEQVPLPAPLKKPNGVHPPGERRGERQSRDVSRASAREPVGAPPVGDGPVPSASPRGGPRRQPQPKQRQAEHRQRPVKADPETEPPYNFRPETDDGGLRAARPKPRPPGRQQRSEYTVSSDRTDRQSPAADAGRDPDPGAVSDLSPGARPRSAQPLPLLHTEQGGPVRYAASQDVALKPINSAGSIRRGSSSLRPAAPLVEEPMSECGPLAVTATSYHFSKGDSRTLSLGDQNPSRLLELYGRPSHRQLMRMWAELFYVVSVPVLLVTTFLYSLLRFVLEAVVRPVAVGPVQLLGDHLLKPAVVALHDSLLLPAATLLANLAAALVLVVRPLAQLLEELVRPLAVLLGSVRLVQVSYGQPPPSGHAQLV